MTKRKVGNQVMLEFSSREEAIAYAEAKKHRIELLEMIYAAGLYGLLSPN